MADPLPNPPGAREDGPQVEVDYLSEPFDIGLEAPSMTTPDHPGQDIAFDAALSSTVFEETLSFQNQRVGNRPLATLSRMFDATRRKENLSNMTKRRSIGWRESDYVVPSTNSNIHWDVKDFYLDLLICRGRDVGIAALLPNLDVHHTIEFKLEMKFSCRKFSPKFAHLEFDPKGAMQFIGRTYRSEDAWMAWIPNEAVGELLDEQDPVPPGTCTGNTLLSERHFNGAFMFLAAELHDMGHRAITVFERYPDLDIAREVELATNIW
jgi:hypothetical protein